ncbi:MAG: hypothetical protein M9897_05235 [Brumimicrobium sp.]|nr:hypothetical protein [Brumimicrobium sp.]
MRKYFLLISLLLFLYSCKDDSKNVGKITYPKDKETQHTHNSQTDLEGNIEYVGDTVEVEMRFAKQGFDKAIYYNLLVETNICNPQYSDTVTDGSSPCSSKFFKFYPYNHNRPIEDAFLLQVRAGVNKYPYRRLLIFVREKGNLVLMNGIIGYLVKRIPQENKVDDLIVAVFDDLGNDKFDRYDVLLRYKDGKYHFIEAIGDLVGEFKTKDLKERASKAIHERILEKNLIF